MADVTEAYNKALEDGYDFDNVWEDYIETGDYRCDYNNCKKKPYAEVYPRGTSTWSYLCIYHFYLERLKLRDIGWGRVDKICRLCGKDLINGCCRDCKE